MAQDEATEAEELTQRRVITEGEIITLNSISESPGTLGLNGSYKYLVGQETAITVDAMIM